MRVGAAARIAGCSPDTVLRWIEEGAILAWRVSPHGWFKVDGSSLARYLIQTSKRQPRESVKGSP